MEQKKETRDQLERRIKNALVFVPTVSDTVSIYFSDRGLRLSVTNPNDFDGYAVIETNYHKHVFNELNANQDTQKGQLPFSRPWLYTKRVAEIANENLEAIKTDAGYSYRKLIEVLDAKEDKSELNICLYFDQWIISCFNPLFMISEKIIDQWLVYFLFECVGATHQAILEEHKEDVTTKQFVERFKELLTECMEGNKERVLFPALSDEERVKQEIEAVQQNAQEELMKGQA